MKTRLLITFAVIILFTDFVHAQSMNERVIQLEDVVIRDTTLLETNHTTTGQKQMLFGKMTLHSGRSRDLGEILATNSAIYIKSMGRGALATASIRGTSSNHTKVLWNEMPINSSMVRGFDFSSIPTFFLDRVTISFGAADSEGSGDVLGGTIKLKSSVQSKGLESLFEYGSNNTQTYGLSAGYDIKNINSSTRVWYQSSDNDFRFLNKVLSKDPFYANRTGCDYKNLGVMQQFSSKFGKNDITADIWTMWSDRSLPQPIVVLSKSTESQTDLSVRSTISLNRKTNRGVINIRGSWLYESLEYERDMNGVGDQNEKNKINTFILDGKYTSQINKKLNYTLFLHGRADINDAYRYLSKNRYTLYVGSMTKWNPTSKFQAGISLKLSTFDDKFIPTGSIGAEWKIIPEQLSISGNVAYNYHAPTLNDLYWQPGGNPDLEPEYGISQDITLNWTIPISNALLKLSASTFRMDINDWIVWLPTERYYWTPRNLNRVRSTGVELSAETLIHIGELSNFIVFNYSYTDASNRKSTFDDDASVGVQLPYVPRHKWNINLTSQYRNFIFNYYLGYTGKRYTSTDQSYSTNEYKLHSASLEWKTELAKQDLTLRLTVDNLFNTYWESTQYYPQPLRTFNLKAIFKINCSDY